MGKICSQYMQLGQLLFHLHTQIELGMGPRQVFTQASDIAFSLQSMMRATEHLQMPAGCMQHSNSIAKFIALAAVLEGFCDPHVIELGKARSQQMIDWTHLLSMAPLCSMPCRAC